MRRAAFRPPFAYVRIAAPGKACPLDRFQVTGIAAANSSKFLLVPPATEHWRSPLRAPMHDHHLRASWLIAAYGFSIGSRVTPRNSLFSLVMKTTTGTRLPISMYILTPGSAISHP